MPPLKKGAYCFATAVGRSVCRPSVVRSISFDPFVNKVYFCDRARYTCYHDVCVLNKRVVVT